MKKLIKKEWNSIERGYSLEYVCDGASDIATLPTEDVAAGSSAIAIDDGKIYIFNSEEWKAFGGDE